MVMVSVSSCLSLAWTLLLAGVAVHAAPQKSARFKACRRDQPAAKINECIKDSIQRAIPELVKGLPDFGLASIDPLRVGNLEIPKNKNSAVNVELSFRNLDVIGLRNLKIKTIDANLDKYTMKMTAQTDGIISLVGDYTIKGKVLVLPITGQGRANITMVNLQGEIVELLAKSFMKNGKEYLQVTTLKFVARNPTRVYYQLDNLFNGNKALGDNMQLVLNDNWKEIFDDMVGPVQKALGEAFKNIINKVAVKVPVNVLFPTGK